MENSAIIIRIAKADSKTVKENNPPRSRQKSLSDLGRTLALRIAFEEFDTEIGPSEIRTGEHGKPYFPEETGLFFNISHSGEYVAAAVARQEIGIDLQEIRPIRNMQHLAGRSLSPSQMERFRASSDPEKTFFELWCELEAYGKYLGCGLVPVLGQEAENCEFQSIPAPSGYCCCICSKSGGKWAYRKKML